MYKRQAAYYKTKNMTLWDAMLAMYEKYGYYKDHVESITLKGIEGLAKIQEIMDTLRSETLTEIGGYKVEKVRDYKKDTITDLATGAVTATGLPKMCIRDSASTVNSTSITANSS